MFGKRINPSVTADLPGARPAGPGLIEIGGRRKSTSQEPATVAGAKDDIVAHLNEAYLDQQENRAETLLNAVGALAGFASQMAIRRGMAEAAGLPLEKLLMEVKGKDGRVYYFGDTLNMILATQEAGKLSVWRIVAASGVKAGADLPDLTPMFKQVASTVGGAQFGVPRIAQEGRLRELPFDALKRHWAPVQAILARHRLQPLHWPLEIAVAAQALIEALKEICPPALAGRIVMESAIMMSKVDPREVPEAIVRLA